MGDEVKPPADAVISRETRDRPGPRGYQQDELVYVKLKNPPGSAEDRTWYQGRVIRSSASRMTVRVVGTGTDLELKLWDVRWYVRKLAEGTGS